ncbi:hypothetical protein Tco_0630005 [Tanacetum coccineum]|uniref:Uncharacterized protein n=1 Tax=Tanacetum coccineum TaxID=301880 RepID=A0ABQ4WV11_9ASTR
MDKETRESGLKRESYASLLKTVAFDLLRDALSAIFGLSELKERHPKSHKVNPVTENPTTTTVTNAQLQAMIDQGVTAALTARDANRNGDDSHTSGTVFELPNGFERMETVFRISNCSVENQIKFSTCTLLAGALTWWNSHDCGQAYAAGTGERKEYAGTLPLCNKCKFHHSGPCTGTTRVIAQIKERNQGNQAEVLEKPPKTMEMVLALGGGETDQDPNNIEDEIEA